MSAQLKLHSSSLVEFSVEIQMAELGEIYILLLITCTVPEKLASKSSAFQNTCSSSQQLHSHRYHKYHNASLHCDLFGL